jgi:broad specificity phosphatase PhoE
MILMRHGQSEFNLHFSATKRDPGIPDPPLTEAGRAQADRAAASLTDAGITRIIASPYTRALQTVAPIARALGLPVIINPVVRERFHFSCDIGTPATALAQAWPDHDFSHIEEVWWPATTETTDSTLERAALFRAEMQATEQWQNTLVVSHWAFLLTFSGQNLQNGDWVRLPNLEAP